MKRDWTSRTAIMLAGAILVVVNLIGVNLFVRADLTDDRVYSLSRASVDVVESLEDPVTVSVYFTDDLPAPYSSNRRFLKDKLDDYRAYGGQRVQYRFVDPNEDPDAERRANQLGIPPVQIQVIEADNVQLKNAYMGLAVEYGGEREVLPLIQDLSTLEYDITSAIRRLTRETTPAVGFLGGHGEAGLSAMPTFVEELRRNYDVQSITVADGELSSIPDVLLIVSPADTFATADLRAIDRYVVGGGRLGLMVNAVNADLQTGQAAPLDVGLSELLGAYGVRVGSDLVMDRRSSPITVQRRAGLFNIAQQVEYPFLPEATRFDPDNMMVNRLQVLRFFFASTVDSTAALPEALEYTPLVFSSDESQTQEGFFMIQPQFAAQLASQELTGGPYALAAAVTGRFPSAFGEGAATDVSRLVLVGDGDVLNEEFTGRVPENIQFGLNMVDWLAQDDALLSIRAKSVEPRRLHEVSGGTRGWVKYLNMFGPVVLVLGIAAIRWRRRRIASLTEV